MRVDLSSLLFLKAASGKNKAAAEKEANQTTELSETPTKTRRAKFTDWLLAKPEPIKLFPNETELFRKGLILVTDTRLAYIDPFDRTLKTYMFEHMISLHKQFYRTTNFNRRLCKALIIISLLALLVVIAIDLLDNNTRGFILVYLPLIASIFIGIKVWNDMKPRYVLHWRMRDMTYGEIAQEPMFRERMMGNTDRETFMNELAEAMNEGLSRKSWWPGNTESGHQLQNGLTPMQQPELPITDTDTSEATSTRPALKLVTENYQ